MSKAQRVASNLHESGLSYAKIGIFLGMSRQRVHQLVKQPTYKPRKRTSSFKPTPLVEFYIWLSDRIIEAKNFKLPEQYWYALEDSKKVLLMKEPLLTLLTLETPNAND